MSDIGLHGSIYEQLRSVADRLDRALVALRHPEPQVSYTARLEIARLLREITQRDTTNPAARLVMTILKRRLPAVSGHGLTLCESLADALEQRPPGHTELAHLEDVALALDKECSSTLARIKGK
jgi:hypothetical protein